MALALTDTDKSVLDVVLAALDELEGFPRQYPRANGQPSPKGEGITKTSGRVFRHPDRLEYALQFKPKLLREHGGKKYTILGVTITVPTEDELVELAEGWFG